MPIVIGNSFQKQPSTEIKMGHVKENQANETRPHRRCAGIEASALYGSVLRHHACLKALTL